LNEEIKLHLLKMKTILLVTMILTKMFDQISIIENKMEQNCIMHIINFYNIVVYYDLYNNNNNVYQHI